MNKDLKLGNLTIKAEGVLSTHGTVSPTTNLHVDESKGIIVNCTKCGTGALLRHSSPGSVSFESLDGWTCPPLLCAECDLKIRKNMFTGYSKPSL